MRKTIEICASFTGTISTGHYENSKPFFSVKETWDTEETIPDSVLKERQKALHNMCYTQFQKEAERYYQDRIEKLYDNIRFYDGMDGAKYPSVTSIINMDTDFNMPPDELAQYGARGTIIHKQVEIFLASGEKKEPKNIPEVFPDLLTLVNGNLGLSLDGYDFVKFFKDYPIEVDRLEQVLLNNEYKYGGRLDILGRISSKNKGKWEKIEGVIYDKPTILDVKTGSIDKTKNFKQLTAYAKCLPSVEQMVIIPLNNDTKQGFSKPIINTDMEKCWTLFKVDRANFKRRYGI